MKKNWTVLLVPHDNIKVRNYTLTRPIIIMGAIITCTLLIVIGMLGYGYYNKNVAVEELSGLETENLMLKKEVLQLGRLTEQLKKRLNGIENLETEYRTIAGLSGIDPEVKQAGIGGPDKRSEVTSGLGVVEKKYTDEIMTKEETLNALIRQADILHQSLTESIEQLKYYQDRLNHTPSIWPTIGRLSSRYGGRVHPIFNGIRKHEGIDISAQSGMPIVATADGVVTFAKWKLGYGLAIEIDHGFDIKTLYAHLSKIKVKKGKRVKRGEIIGLVGSTGISTGPHLHYEVKIDGKSKNPVNYILGYSVPD